VELINKPLTAGGVIAVPATAHFLLFSDPSWTEARWVASPKNKYKN